MAIVNLSERDIHSEFVKWVRAVTDKDTIKSHQSGPTSFDSYLTVQQIDMSRVREHLHSKQYDEDVESERVMASTVSEWEWQFSVHSYDPKDPASSLRRLAMAIELNQTLEPLFVDMIVHDTSDIRVMPEERDEQWEPHAQMDVWVRGLVREAFLIDLIEESNLVAGFDLGNETEEPPPTPPAPQISTFTFAAGTYNVGDTATLTWSLSGGTVTSVAPVVTAPGGGTVALSGSGNTRTFVVQVAGTYSATLTAVGPGGTANASTSMLSSAVVPPAPSITAFAFNAGTYNVGDTATITWALAGGTTTSITPSVSGPSGNVALTGSGNTRSFVVAEAGNYAATLAVTGPGGNANATATAVANVVVLAPTITAFAFAASTYNVGDTGTIAWTLGGGPTTSVTPVVTAPGGGTVTLSGSGNTRTFTVAVAGTYSATLLAVGAGGNANASASMVASAVAPEIKPIQYLFDHATVTPSGAGSDNQGIVVGFVFYVDAPGKVASVAFYKNANDVQTSRSVAIYNSSNQTVIATGVSVAEPVGVAGWVIVPLSAEVALTPGTFYIAAAHSPGLGHYTFKSGAFASPVKRGAITGTAANDPSVPPPLGNGRYKYSSSIAFPDGTAVGSTSYMVDVGFRPD